MKDIGTRMKEYESASSTVLTRRTPTIIRLDGKAFHTYTKQLERPYCFRLHELMCSTAMFLCGQIQNAVFAYTQSDEISILMAPYKKLTTEPWFDNKVQKIVSVAASMCSVYFTEHSNKLFDEERKPAYFDARVFVLPDAEVCNYFVWRQQDAVRNSIQMLAQSLYSQKQLHRKDTNEMQEMCWNQGKNWNDVPTRLKRGAAIYYRPGGTEQLPGWCCDLETPTFTKDRDYVEKHMIFDEEEGNDMK